MPHNNLLPALASAVLLCCLAVLPAPCQPRQMRVHSLPTQSLLPVAQVHDIVHTDDGIMWYATSDGLCRDNGYQIDVFRPGRNDGGVMRGSNIWCLVADKSRLLFSTGEGLYAMDLGSLRISRITLPDGVSSGVNAIIIARDGSVWLTSGESIVHLSRGLKPVKVYSDGKGGAGLYEDSQRRVWHMADGGLSVMRPRSRRFVSVPWTGQNPVAMCPADGGNRFWVATFGDGIVLYDAVKGAVMRQEASLAGGRDSRIISMRRDHTGGLLWATTMSGLDTYSTAGGRLTWVDAVGGIPDRKLIVDKLCEDRDGNMWVAGFSPTTFIVAPDMGRVRRMTVDAMRQLTGFFLLADRMVTDSDGYYWIWQGRYGLSLFSEAKGLTFLYDVRPQGLYNVERGIQRCATVHGIMAYSGGTVWHLWHDGMRIKAERMTDVDGGSICGIRADARGRLWIATHKTVSLFLPVSGQVRTVYRGGVSLLGETVSSGQACLFAKGQAVFMVSDRGIVSRVADIGEDITCMVTGAGGNVYVSTKGGHVFSCKDGRAEPLATLGDANGNTIKQLSVDEAGCLWTLTDQTVTRYNLQTGACVRTAASDPDIAVDYFYSLEPESGGMGVTGAGAYCVLPTLPMDNEAMTGIVPFATAVSVGDSIILIGQGRREADIPAGAASVGVSLATGEHLLAGKVSFAWRVGQSGAWIVLDQGTNRAFLGRLSKGDYDIYVKATDRFGNWGEPRLCLTLHRLPAWYETWWAWLLYVLAALAAVGALVWLASRIWYLKRLQHLRGELNLKQVSIEPEDVSTKRYDAEFTQRMVQAIEDHLGDTSYNVMRLAADMNTSRANLFRKCRALTGKNPTSLIREIRLKAAATMLGGDPDASVADIAAKVGFATPSYFAKCFKEMFGKLPNEYRH